MKKILFIDVFCPYGHINLNKTFINQFNKLGYEVDFVLKKGYNKEIGVEENSLKWSVPDFYYRESAGKILSRLNSFFILFLLRAKVNTREYDYIFFSSYEEISLWFSGFRGKFILINHANIAGLENFLKRFFIKRLSKSSINVVFHDFIRISAEKYGIRNIKVQPLGLSNPYRIDIAKQKTILSDINEKLINEHLSDIIFIPSGQKYGDNFIKEIIESKVFIEFLSSKNILLVIKDKTIKCSENNILMINNYISNEQYENLFLASTLVLLNYPHSFKNRVSAILFESFSCNKACLLSEIKGFTSFRNYFNYNPYYSDIESLISRIDDYLNYSKDDSNNPYKNLENLNPNFASLFIN